MGEQRRSGDHLVAIARIALQAQGSPDQRAWADRYLANVVVRLCRLNSPYYREALDVLDGTGQGREAG